MKNNYYSLIPARGGSKGVKRKNIKDLNGKPLILYTISASKKAGIENTFVSTEDPEIKEVSEKLGAKIVVRPDELANDTAPTIPVILHFINVLNLSDNDVIILLQPTSPLRDDRDLKKAIEKFEKTKADSLISVYKPKIEILKGFIEEDGFLRGAINNEYPFTRRQDLPNSFMANGAIYISRVLTIKKYNSLLGDKCVSYEMPIERSVNIDTEEDFLLAEKLMKAMND